MPVTAVKPAKTRSKPLKERRKPAGAPGSMRWLGGVLGRPLGVGQGEVGPRIVLIERRKAPDAPAERLLPQVCAALRSRLEGHDSRDATRVMRHLALVHDELGRRGWGGIEAMPSRVLGMALVQAQMLTSDEPSTALSQLIDRLRIVKVAVEVREERLRSAAAADCQVEVSEVTHEEFTRSERSWLGEAPADPPPSVRNEARD